MGYQRQVFKGFSLNGIVTISTALASAVKIFFLARLLSPQDFGLFSLIAVLLGTMESLTETGINTTLVQSEKSIHYFLDTAWVISIFRGFLIAIFILLAGIFLKNSYHEDTLLSLAAVAAFIPVVRGFINPMIVSLHKNLLFFRDSLYRLSLVIVDMIAAVICAVIFKSSFAFLFGMITAASFEVVLTFLIFSDTPRFQYIHSRAKEIYQNAKSLNLSAALGYGVQNIDNLLVGKLVGTSALGLYAQSYSLSHKTNLELAKSVQHATFPVFTKIGSDAARLRAAFWKSTTTSIAGFFLLSLPFIFFPKFVVDVLLGGGKWSGAETLLPTLAVAGLIQSLILLMQNIFTSVKKYWWLNSTLALNFVSLFFLIVLWGSASGLDGVLKAVIVSRIVTLAVAGIGISRVLHFSSKK